MITGLHKHAQHQQLHTHPYLYTKHTYMHNTSSCTHTPLHAHKTHIHAQHQQLHTHTPLHAQHQQLHTHIHPYMHTKHTYMHNTSSCTHTPLHAQHQQLHTHTLTCTHNTHTSQHARYICSHAAPKMHWTHVLHEAIDDCYEDPVTAPNMHTRRTCSVSR